MSEGSSICLPCWRDIFNRIKYGPTKFEKKAIIKEKCEGCTLSKRCCANCQVEKGTKEKQRSLGI
jgi:hypothetical protein